MISGAREPLRPDLREALRYLGVRGEPEPELARRLEAAADRLAALPPPVWRWEVYDLERRADGMALEFLPARLKTEEVCIEAVRQCGRVLRIVPERLKTPAGVASRCWTCRCLCGRRMSARLPSASIREL